MDGILIRERYKVVQVLWRAENYAAVEVVDIQERENPTLLMNLYGGDLLHRYGEIYAGMKDCPAFRGMFLEDGALAAVFRPAGQGVPIDWLFYRGDQWSWNERLNAAGIVMHLALSLAALPPEVSCAALCSDNLLLDPDEGSACARFLIRPMGEMTCRELTLMAGDQLKKLLPRRWSSCDRQLELLERLELGDFPSIVPMYAWWRREEEQIRADVEALAQKFHFPLFYPLVEEHQAGMQSGQEGDMAMRVRKGLSFLVILIYAACAGLVLFRPAADSLSVLQKGYGTTYYEAVGVGEAGEVAAASRAGEKLQLTFGTLEGEYTGKWSTPLSPGAAQGSLARLYPVGENTVFLAVYEDGDENWSDLVVYRVVRGKGAEALLRIPCTGDSAALRRDSVSISTFSRENGEVRFAVLSPDGIQGYACRENSGGVEERERLGEQPALSAAVLPDGSLAVGGAGFLTVDGDSAAGDLSKQNITYLTQAGAGLFYLDSAGLEVFYSDLTGTGVRETTQLGVNEELDDVTSLALTDRGGALLLLGGRRLVLDEGRNCAELTGMLYRSAGACWGLLLGGGLVLLLLTVLVWYGLEGRGTGQVSVAVRWGGILLAGALTICTVLLLFVIRPAQEENHRTIAENALSGAVSLAAPQWEGDAARLTRSLTCAMERTASGHYRDATARAYLPDGDSWVLEAPASGMPAGSRGEVTGSFSAALAQKARDEGMASRLEGGRFELYLRGNLGLVVLSVDDSTLMGWMTRQETVLEIALLVGIALLVLLGVVNLIVVALGMRRLAGGMERLAEGNFKGRVNIYSGDELEGLSSSLNSLAKAMETQERKREDLTRAYRRFVPERVLALLGKQSILEVDKSTLATRRMAVMMVEFSFPAQVYDNRMREFFDSVNQVIERTAGVVSRMGGTVFNFAYNGYDVVLEGDEALAVSTAVAVRQEVLSLNEARDMAGLPTVRLSIALDIGDVMVGVVGDESQMEPTTLSTSFTTVKRLIRLCSRLEAGILCTESIIAGAKEYGSRYMGRSGQGEQSVRVYEIFEGDPYSVRRLKESTVGEFTQAVYALYSQDYPAAKRTFLELVHNGQADGGARYYLYLSDKLEKGGGDNISLD